MHTLFVVLDYLSVFVMIACVVIVSTHESISTERKTRVTVKAISFVE